MVPELSSPASHAAGPNGVARLLELDSGLGRLLSEEQRAAATRALLVRVVGLPAGPGSADSVPSTAPDHLGLVLVDGILVRELRLGPNPTVELLGPGDVLRPWVLEYDEPLLDFESTWTVLVPSRVALLDRDVTNRLGRWPPITTMIADRLVSRCRRLAALQAIAQIVGVERRVLALLWHLAERWGRVTPAGVVVRLPITHSLIGELIGARRPTISAAVRELGEQGQLERRSDRTWLLTGRPEDAMTFVVADRRARLADGSHG